MNELIKIIQNELKISNTPVENFEDPKVSPIHEKNVAERQKITSSSPSQIKPFIINTLRSLPNYSCTKKSMVSKVLKNLNITLLGNERKTFERKVNRSIGFLKIQGYVQEYKAKNLRIKLTEKGKSSIISISHLENEMENAESLGTSDIGQRHDTLDAERNIEDILDSTVQLDIPDLPDYDDGDDSYKSEEEVDFSTEHEPGDKDAFLDLLEGTNDNKRQEKNEIDYTFRELEQYYSSNTQTVLQKSHGELILTQESQIGKISVFYNQVGISNNLSIKIFIPLIDSAIKDILMFYSHIDNIGEIGMEKQRNEEYLIIKKMVNLYKHNSGEVIKISDRLLYECFKIVDIILEYL